MIRRQEKNLMGRPHRRRGPIRFLPLLIVALAAPFLPHLLLKRHSAAPVLADALFVLTGGERRIAEGYRAFREGRASDLYILGVGRDITLEKILPKEGRDTAAEKGRVFAEGWSENTLENAYSAKSVVSTRRFGIVILVTSDYHMARASLTFRRILPRNVTVFLMPVRTEWRGLTGFLRTARLFYFEGWKYWGYRFFLLFE